MRVAHRWIALCGLLQALARYAPRRQADKSPALTELDERQLRDAGLCTRSQAELRELGLVVRRAPALDTPFRARRSVL